jgi:hypothetical protein
MTRNRFSLFLLTLGSVPVFITACVSSHNAVYENEIAPLFDRYCVGCHSPPSGEGFIKVGLNLEDCESAHKGTVYGPVINPGDSRKSIITMLVEGRADPSMNMPHDNRPSLTDDEIHLLRDWIDQGAKCQ